MQTRIVDVAAVPLEVPLVEPFRISCGVMDKLSNVLVRVTLENGVVGLGEAAPWPELTGESQATVLATCSEAGSHLIGLDAASLRQVSAVLKRQYKSQTSARAGLETAVFDAYSQTIGIPLFRFFGGAGDRVETDLTIPIVPPADAPRLARAVVARGIRTIKTKVGNDMEEDVERVRVIHEAAPEAHLILDANQAYTPSGALRFLARLERLGIEPVLLEQPVHGPDLDGLKYVKDRTNVPVAADEAVHDAHDALALARMAAADVVNLKLMKCGGMVEAMDIVSICKTANIQLMIGGMMESRVAMNASAHLAAGLGGFSFIDLDTHMLLAEDPFEGGFRQEDGWLILDQVKSGTGIRWRTQPPAA